MKKAVLVIIGVMLGTYLMAQPGMGQRRAMLPRQGMDRMEMMKDKLDLSDAQAEKMEAIHTDFLGDVQPIKNQLDIKRAELKAAISAEQSKGIIDGFVAEINTLRNQQFELEISRIMEVRGMLDDDQKVIFDAIASHRDGGPKGAGKRGRY